MIKGREKWVAGLAVVALVFMASVANAQPQGERGRGGQGGPGGGGRMPMFGGGGAMGNVMLLMREDVRKHLDLLDEQVEELQAVAQEMFQGMRNRSAEERETATKDLEKKINEILLPHQVKRVEQIATQQRMQRGGLLSDDIVEKLSITEAQREKLTAKQQEVREDLAKKIAELRKQSEEKLVSELTPAQRAKLKELIGEPFDLTAEQGRGGFPGGFGGGRGAPGQQPQGGPGGAGGRRRG